MSGEFGEGSGAHTRVTSSRRQKLQSYVCLNGFYVSIETNIFDDYFGLILCILILKEEMLEYIRILLFLYFLNTFLSTISPKIFKWNQIHLLSVKLK